MGADVEAGGSRVSTADGRRSTELGRVHTAKSMPRGWDLIYSYGTSRVLAVRVG